MDTFEIESVPRIPVKFIDKYSKTALESISFCFLHNIYWNAGKDTKIEVSNSLAAVVYQSIRAFALHAEDWVFESQPQERNC